MKSVRGVENKIRSASLEYHRIKSFSSAHSEAGDVTVVKLTVLVFTVGVYRHSLINRKNDSVTDCRFRHGNIITHADLASIPRHFRRKSAAFKSKIRTEVRQDKSVLANLKLHKYNLLYCTIF